MPAIHAQHRWKECLGIGGALFFVVWFFWFTISSAGGFRLDGEFDYYNPLVEGWRRGQLSLPITPDPRLVALKDPYDPAQNWNLRLPDASYYQGKYYIYFGPAPAAVLMLPYRLLTGRSMPQGVAVLVFCLIGIGAASALWLDVRRRYFPESAWWSAGLGILVLGLGTHVLALARRPCMWELSIATSYAFIMLALLSIGWALHGRRPVVALGMAGLAVGLAMAARPTALLTTVLFVPPLWYFWRARGVWLRGGLAAATAMGGIVAILLWYNHARFDSVWEFGQKYQLTGVNESKMKHFALDYAWHNLRLYFFWPVQWTLDWPFVTARPLPPGPSGYYAGEEVYWLAVLFPVVWFAPISLLAWARDVAGERSRLKIVILSIAGVHLALGALMMSFFSATERYMVEFVPALLLLALCGAMCAERAALTGHWRRWVRVVFAIAGGVTVVAGLMISFDYHRRSMARTDPRTWEWIMQTVARMQRSAGWQTPYAIARHLQQWVPGQSPGTVQVLPRADKRDGSGEDILLEKSQEGLCRVGLSRAPGGVRWSDWFDPHEPVRDSVPSESTARPGGVLVMKMCLPDVPMGVAEPLLVLGRQHAADVLALRHVGDKHWQVIFDHWAHPLWEGPVVRLERGKWHEFRIALPSCRADAFGQAVTGEAIVIANGGEMLRVDTPLYAFDAATMDFGRNRVGATTCRPAFTGWILQTEWVGE